MSFSAIDLCSRALLKIGASPVASFEDGTAEAEAAAGLYPLVRDGMLSAHPWNFAIHQTMLARLAAPPMADYAYAYQLPVDCLRVLSAGAGHRGSGLAYRVHGHQLHTDSESVTLTYVRRELETNFPPFFAIALIAQLASELCIPLTDSTSRWERLRQVADVELRRARLIDSQEETAPRIEDFSLLEGRF